MGLSLAVLLAQHNQVLAFDIMPEKIAMLNNKQSPIADNEIEDFLINRPLDLTGTLDKNQAYQDSEYVIIATPTDYNKVTNNFDTESVEAVIQDVLAINPNAIMIIKSTVPVGFTNKIKQQFDTDNILILKKITPENIINKYISHEKKNLINIGYYNQKIGDLKYKLTELNSRLNKLD